MFSTVVRDLDVSICGIKSMGEYLFPHDQEPKKLNCEYHKTQKEPKLTKHTLPRRGRSTGFRNFEKD